MFLRLKKFLAIVWQLDAKFNNLDPQSIIDVKQHKEMESTRLGSSEHCWLIFNIVLNINGARSQVVLWLLVACGL